MSSTINANMAECIRSATHIGFNRHHNICNGTIYDVPWGMGDWIMVLLLGGSLLAAIALLCAVIVLFVKAEL